MRKRLVVLILLASLLVPAPARAQADVQFDEAVVHLWPEFDKPEMLVIMQLLLSPDVALPRDLDFRVPAGVTIQVVAVGPAHNTVEDEGIIYETRTEGEWMVIAVKNVSAPAVRIEYYDRLEMEGAARHYVYQWPGQYSTHALTLVFQQPVDATGLTLIPAPVGGWSDDNGLAYYQVDYGALAAGETAALAADYQKSTSRLSMSVPQVQPESPLGGDAEGRVSFSNYLPWLVGGAGVLLIVVALAFGLSYWRGTGGGSGRRRRHAAARPAKEEPPAAANCPECGRRLQPGDKFCRACGARAGCED